MAGTLIGIFEGLGYPQPEYMKADWLEATAPELLHARPDQVLLWRPRAGHDRILAQQSLLAVAAISDNPWGSFGFPREDEGTDLEMGAGTHQRSASTRIWRLRSFWSCPIPTSDRQSIA